MTRKEKLAKVLELMIAEKPWRKLYREVLREMVQEYEIRTNNS